MQYVTREELDLLMAQIDEISEKINDFVIFKETLDKDLDVIQQRLDRFMRGESETI